MVTNKNIGCLIMAVGAKYVKLGDCAKDSFIKFHPDIPLYYFSDPAFRGAPPGVLKYDVARAVMQEQSLKKLIILGADTITCSRLDEFMDNDEDILCSLDYPYPFESPRFSTQPHQSHVNADVVCFNSLSALDKVIEVSQYHGTYYEQGGLNEVVWSDDYSFTSKIVDGPYEQSDVVYNARAKGNIVAGPGEKPWAKYTRQFYVKDDKLYTRDHKQIKVWHYCEGFGGVSEERMDELISSWARDWFNDETKKFFTEVCDCKEFFKQETFVQ